MEKHTDREKKRNVTALTCLLFALMAGMVIAYAAIADDRIFYFVSVAMMMLTTAAMFIGTERKRPRTSEVVIVSTMVTIAVVCRAAFFMLPEIKPAAAVVIISAVCLGGRTGFMIGALSMFISNFMFGQGPWTPCQMFAMGMTGLIAGAVINLHEKMRSPLAMAAVSGVCTFTVYGLLVDIWTAFGFYARPTPESVLAVYAAAVPLNAIFAVSTGIFVFFFGEPVIKKIERVKLKYGIFYSRI